MVQKKVTDYYAITTLCIENRPTNIINEFYLEENRVINITIYYTVYTYYYDRNLLPIGNNQSYRYTNR